MFKGEYKLAGYDNEFENLPLAQKHRPNTIKKYVGNEKIKISFFSQMVNDKKRPQIILLTGKTGCGKTTFGRLILKEYNCENRNVETGACGVCPSCIAFDEYIATGNFDNLSNVHEVDLTDKSNKRDFSPIFEEMQIPAFGDEWKGYIFDECHAMSDSLQNRMLKITEEPPEQVVMIFCTTDPELLIDTLKNRCQLEYNVVQPTMDELTSLLKDVCNKEGVEYDIEGLRFISTRSEFVFREALKLMQRVIREKHSVKYESVVSVFDAISSSLIISYFKALKNRNVHEYVTILNKAKEKFDLSLFLTELKNFVKRGIYIINGLDIEGVSTGDIKIYRDLFGDFGVDEIGAMLSRILSLDVKNLEMELLLLGYTGLSSAVSSVEESSGLTLIAEIENEIVAEERNASAEVKSEENKKYQKGVENAESMIIPADFSSLLDLGATLVED